MKTLIAIPVFNEVDYLDAVLDRVLSYHSDVVCVDDGSTDGTTEKLEKRTDIQLLRHEANKGYGQSLVDAFNYAETHNYDWVITMDCDEQHEPSMIPAFLHEISANNADIISGSRYLKAHDGDSLPPEERRSINVTMTMLINGLFHWNLTDAFCGFKAHNVAATQRLHLGEAGYAFPMQLWPRAAAAGLRIREIPVQLIYNDPNRYFGGNLDDPSVRLRHYLQVLQTELQWTPEPVAMSCFCECGA